MPQRTDTLDLARLGLTSGEGRRLDLHVALDGFRYGGEQYVVTPPLVPVRLDVDRTMGSGWALRLRFDARMQGPCMRCLERAEPRVDVDVREVDQAQGGDELASPYVSDAELDLHAWARDALALALPAQITCRGECRGLCPQCGVSLNDDPAHAHEQSPDPRWSKLSEIRFE